jgi:hypothetical protein
MAATRLQLPAVRLVVPLDARIQIHTEIQTTKYRHCAVIHIGRTNYRIKVGGIIHWTDNRQIPPGDDDAV